MAINIKSLSEGLRTVQVKWHDEVCNIQYQPGANTTARAIALQEAIQEGGANATEAVIDALLAMVVSWDLVDEKDKPVPVTKELFMQLPMSFITAIMQAITDDQNPPTKRRSGR